MQTSFKAYAEALLILAKYSQEDFVLCAEHDIIYTQVSSEELPEDSIDGKKLREEYGWHTASHNDCWARFT